MAMRFSICGKRYYFTFKFWWLTVIFVLAFCSLGTWQEQRAKQKSLLIQSYTQRMQQQPISAVEIFDSSQDNRFSPARLRGHFDTPHTILLDNKTFEGKVGYEVYTPFVIAGFSKAILVDRGWVAADSNRAILPKIEPVPGKITILGTLNSPPAYYSMGVMAEPNSHFPLRVQYIDFKELSPIMPYPLAPYILWLDVKDPNGFQRQWKVTFMPPEKHTLYAVQWFAFALSLLVIFLVLNFHKEKP